ncbi:Proliferating cell nuclear antigen [Morella rubra]|uniref:Proliferating cell nuclear antigen n=1 Tax=Morella rubra TaxID=262757 RepID=A0A6A1UZL0_9ROSI|nr:Proliferating cell nuclear antigen [Morella rubra]
MYNISNEMKLMTIFGSEVKLVEFPKINEIVICQVASLEGFLEQDKTGFFPTNERAVVISVTRDAVKFTSRGDIFGTVNIIRKQNTNVEKPKESVIVETKKPVTLTFGLGYMNSLNSFAKATPLINQVTHKPVFRSACSNRVQRSRYESHKVPLGRDELGFGILGH